MEVNGAHSAGGRKPGNGPELDEQLNRQPGVAEARLNAREQLDFGLERPALENYPAYQPYWLVQGPNLWPDDALPELRGVAMAWADQMSRVGAEVLGAIAVSLELREDHFAAAFQGTPAWMAKLIHYVGGVVKEAGSQGVGAHAAQSRGISDDRENPMLASYGANVLKGWLRAQPEVAQLHHPRLIRAPRTD